MLIGFGIVGAEETPPTDKTADTPAVKKQTVCPVEGGAINTNLYADYNGKRVYFCCKGCPAEFKKDQAKYIGKLEKGGVTLEKVPAKDPTRQQTADAEAVPAQGHDHSTKKAGECCE